MCGSVIVQVLTDFRLEAPHLVDLDRRRRAERDVIKNVTLFT